MREDWEHGFFESEIGQPARLAVSYPHPDYGRFEQPGAFWDLGDVDLTLDLAPPLLGQHTSDVLHELGFDAGAIRKLADTGVIGGPEL